MKRLRAKYDLVEKRDRWAQTLKHFSLRIRHNHRYLLYNSYRINVRWYSIEIKFDIWTFTALRSVFNISPEQNFSFSKASYKFFDLNSCNKYSVYHTGVRFLFLFLKKKKVNFRHLHFLCKINYQFAIIMQFS